MALVEPDVLEAKPVKMALASVLLIKAFVVVFVSIKAMIETTVENVELYAKQVKSVQQEAVLLLVQQQLRVLVLVVVST